MNTYNLSEDMTLLLIRASYDRKAILEKKYAAIAKRKCSDYDKDEARNGIREELEMACDAIAMLANAPHRRPTPLI
jgi:hypothetical protein